MIVVSLKRLRSDDADMPVEPTIVDSCRYTLCLAMVQGSLRRGDDDNQADHKCLQVDLICSCVATVDRELENIDALQRESKDSGGP